MSIEEQYQDILQNIEFAIVQEYQRDRTLLDYDVADALEALIRMYRSEQGGGSPPLPRLAERPKVVFEAARVMCEWRLGRAQMGDQQMPKIEEPITIGEMIDCLKRIEKSVRRWNKQNGRQGYLNFVSKYII